MLPDGNLIRYGKKKLRKPVILYFVHTEHIGPLTCHYYLKIQHKSIYVIFMLC